MKKILSIILALGLVLSMSLAAMPALADDLCEATVVVDPACAEGAAEYCIEFESKYQMLAGNDEFVIEFLAGTLGTVTATLNGFATTATKDGMLVYVAVPADAGNIPAGDTVIICISEVTNPVEGKYTLNVWVDMLCCPLELICSGDYTITPAYSTYKFVLDFGKTYTGIGEDVVPPFKACGQEDFGYPEGDRWFTEFDLFLRTDVEGCLGYDPVIINFWLKSAPVGGNVTLDLFGWDGVVWPPDWHRFQLLVGEDPEQWGYHGATPPGFPLPAVINEAVEARIHFNVPGYYEICFELEYLGEVQTCQPDIEGGILVERCVTAQVMQDKDAIDIDPFGAKWNFFSTPLRLKYDAIDDVFAPLGDNLKAVWHWDNVQGKWFHYSPNSVLPADAQPLSKIEDGKGYMVRMLTVYEGFEATAPVPTLWLFGHAQAYAPLPPFSYNVAPGWTMMGFTSMVDMNAGNYLLPSVPLDPDGIKELAGSAYVTLPLAGNMQPGFGYWVYFTAAGQVVP